VRKEKKDSNAVMKTRILITIFYILLVSFVFGQTEVKSESKLNYELISILDTIHYNDQKYREKTDEIAEKYGLQSSEMKEIWKTMLIMDSLNLIKVKKIIDENGWLGSDIIGEKGNKTLFLVIQHSDYKTQAAYIPVLREAVKNHNAKASHLALLEDRVALSQGKRQIYGSQVGQDNKTGEYYIFPIEDPDNVDKRRSEVGLEPISEYLKTWNLNWDPKMHKAMIEEKEKKHHEKQNQ
jgi:hypothetical protein